MGEISGHLSIIGCGIMLGCLMQTFIGKRTGQRSSWQLCFLAGAGALMLMVGSIIRLVIGYKPYAVFIAMDALTLIVCSLLFVLWILMGIGGLMRGSSTINIPIPPEWKDLDGPDVIGRWPKEPKK